MNQRPLASLELPRATLALGKTTLIMGVVNVTPDSFSDGGHFLDASRAVEQGLKLAEEGAHILDVGGESTRPGSEGVSASQEMDRVLPVIEGLAAQSQAVLSIDTSKAAVARAALAAGAQMVNDVTALTGDAELAPLVAESGAGVILMHMKGSPRTMQKDPVYDDVVAEVRDYLAARVAAAQAAGIDKGRVVVDPGIGFGKTLEHNLLLIRRLADLRSLGCPVLLGASRKAFIGHLTGRPPLERTWGTLGCHVAGALLGADIVRVHEVAALREALAVSDAVMAAGD